LFRVGALGWTCMRFRSWRMPSMRKTGKVARARLCPDHGEVLGWSHQLRGPVRVTYEAGPTGFGLARAITEAGMECLVAAPSKLQRPAGDRVKTDARDAAHLARLLRLGEITEVRVPEREIEAVRDLVRARRGTRLFSPTAATRKPSAHHS
jgi:transposase